MRQQLPEGLERIKTIIEPENINLEEVIRIGEDVKEVLHYKPGKFCSKVLQNG